MQENLNIINTWREPQRKRRGNQIVKFSEGKQRRRNTVFKSNLVAGSIGWNNVEKQILKKVVQNGKYNNNNIPCLKKIFLVFKAVQHNSIHNNIILIEKQWIENIMICHS